MNKAPNMSSSNRTTARRADRYIGRSQLKKLVYDALMETLTNPDQRAAIFVVGPGGLGKSFFHLRLPSILLEEAKERSTTQSKEGIDTLQVLAIQPVEGSLAGTQLETGIMDRLVEGLKGKPGMWWRLPEWKRNKTGVSQIFHDYYQIAEAYREAKRSGAGDVEKLRNDLLVAFISAWNYFSAQKRVILSIDTLERMFPLSYKETMESDPDILESIKAWAQLVLPRLEHTLILLSGRDEGSAWQQIFREALEAERTSLVSHGLERDLTDVWRSVPIRPQRFEPLNNLADIKAYLEASFDANVKVYGRGKKRRAYPGFNYGYVQRATEGEPLLLTLFARFYEALENDPPQSKSQFERWLLNHVLNPLLDEKALGIGHALRWTFYFLSIAEGGLTVEQLERLFRALDLELGPKDLPNPEDLKNEPLIREIAGRYFLLDEVRRRIRESKRSKAYGFGSKDVLDELIKMSRDEVKTYLGKVGLAPQVSEMQLLESIYALIYYELLADEERGLYQYARFADLLISAPQRDLAAILKSKVRMSIGQILSEKSRKLAVQWEDIRNLRTQWDWKTKEARQETVSASQKLFQQHNKDRRIRFQTRLSLESALLRAITLSRANVENRSLEVLIQTLESYLDSKNNEPLPTSESGLKLRYLLALAEAYTYNSQYLSKRGEHQKAVDDSDKSVDYYNRYDEENGGSYLDDTDIYRAQVLTNMAWDQLHLGQSDNAKSSSDDALTLVTKNKHNPLFAPRRKALFQNVNAHINITREKIDDTVRIIVERAKQSAKESQNRHTQLLVARTDLFFTRKEVWAKYKDKIIQDVIDPNDPKKIHGIRDDAKATYERSSQQPKHELAWLDIRLEYARSLRDLATLYHERDQQDEVAKHWKLSTDQLREIYGEAKNSNLLVEQVDILENLALNLVYLRKAQEARAEIEKADQALRKIESKGKSVQLLCGKVALQSARCQYAAEQHITLKTLQFMGIALTRAFVLAGNESTHTDLSKIRWAIEQEIETATRGNLQECLEWLRDQRSGFDISSTDLPYHQPNADDWNAAWLKAKSKLTDLVRNRLRRP